MKKTIIILVLVLAVCAGFIVGAYKGREQGLLSSVTVGNEYKATTTPWFQSWTDQSLDTGPGTLG